MRSVQHSLKALIIIYFFSGTRKITVPPSSFFAETKKDHIGVQCRRTENFFFFIFINYKHRCTMQKAGINNLTDFLYQFQNGILIPNLMYRVNYTFA
jgi:hypothetical protein